MINADHSSICEITKPFFDMSSGFVNIQLKQYAGLLSAFHKSVIALGHLTICKRNSDTRRLQQSQYQ
jgi:hypothetical protein